MEHTAWLKKSAESRAEEAKAELVKYVKESVKVGSIYNKKGHSRRTVLNVNDDGEVLSLKPDFLTEELPPRFFLTMFDGYEPTEEVSADFITQVKLVCGV